ncbi:MAG: lysophospholipid acyltransferase family protein [Holosporaceae bacterium]|nr:lysophospholipid acyltransferase family protein [Holosporaceae bacterium]
MRRFTVKIKQLSFSKIKNRLFVFFKKKRKKKRFEIAISKTIAFLMRISFYTTRWTVVGEGIPESYHKKKVPFIVCLWHDRLMMAPCAWKWEKPLHVLASNHLDGRMMAKIVEHFSMPAVFGSTGKNGIAAAKKLIQLVKAGEYVAIIPDGPKGPRHKAALGIVAIAKLTKSDILPFSFCVKRYYRFKSWDKLIWVWPFNRGVMVWEKPISAAELKTMSEKESIQYVEARINNAAQKAYEILTHA